MATDRTPQGYIYLDDQQEQPEVVINGNYDLADRLTAGIFHLQFATDADYILATNPTGGVPPEWQYFIVYATDTGGVLTAGRDVVVPTGHSKPYMFVNESGQNLGIRGPATGTLGQTVNNNKGLHVFATPAGNVIPIANTVNAIPSPT